MHCLISATHFLRPFEHCKKNIPAPKHFAKEIILFFQSDDTMQSEKNKQN